MVYGDSHAIWKCDFLRKEVFRRNRILQRSYDSVTGIGVIIILARNVPEAECVIFNNYSLKSR